MIDRIFNEHFFNVSPILRPQPFHVQEHGLGITEVPLTVVQVLRFLFWVSVVCFVPQNDLRMYVASLMASSSDQSS